MATTKISAAILDAQVDATLQQARQMEEVVDSLARFGVSLLRLPVLMAQALTLLCALPFVGCSALTGVLDRTVARMNRSVDARVAKVGRTRPVVPARPSTTLYSQPAPSVALKMSHSA